MKISGRGQEIGKGRGQKRGRKTKSRRRRERRRRKPKELGNRITNAIKRITLELY